MERKCVSLFGVLLAMALFSCPAFAKSFSDVPPDAPYAEAVNYVYEAGLMGGVSENQFAPEMNVRRGDFAIIICRIIGEEKDFPDGVSFSDVPQNSYMTQYISKAVQLGIINGYGDGRFGPLDSVTCEQAITMLVRAKGLAQEAENRGGYPDGYIRVANDRGYIRNVSNKKGDALPRSAVAVILYNAFSGQTTDSPNSSQANYTITRRDHSLRNSKGDIVYSSYYDQVILDGNGSQVSAINGVIEKDYRSNIKQITNINELDTAFPPSASDPFEDTYDASVTYNRDGIFSIEVIATWFMGGVRNVVPYGMTFNLNTGKQASISEIVNIEKDYLQIYVRKKIAHYFFDSDSNYGLFPDAENTIMQYDVDSLAYYVDRNGEINVCIPVYEIGPAASDSFVVPLALKVGATRQPVSGAVGRWMTCPESTDGVEKYVQILDLKANEYTAYFGYYRSEVLVWSSGTYHIQDKQISFHIDDVSVFVDFDEPDVHLALSSDAKDCQYEFFTIGDAIQMVQLSNGGIYGSDDIKTEKGMTFVFFPYSY